jgi:hypothetical protein
MYTSWIQFLISHNGLIFVVVPKFKLLWYILLMLELLYTFKLILSMNLTLRVSYVRQPYEED